MSNKIFKDLIKPQAKLSRNGFDRSYLHNFTAKIGELLPIMAVETVPGSHYEIRVSDLMRTLPMHQAAFIRASQHFEFYFVPYKQLWHRWDDFYTTRVMPNSSSVSMAVPQAAPCNSLANILGQIKTTKGSLILNYGDLGETIGAGADKIANLLGYVSNKGCVNGIPEAWSDLKPNLFRPAAYQKICFDYYRQPFYDLPYDGISYNFNLDDADISTGIVTQTYSSSGITQYRLARLFQLHYRQWKKDLFTGVLPDTQFGAVSVVSTGSDTPEQVTRNIELAVSASLGNLRATGLGATIVTKESNGYPSADDSVSVDTMGNIIATTGEDGLAFGNYVELPGGSPSARIQTQLLNGNVSGTASGTYTDTTGGSGAFDVISLVRAQAIQRWKEITLRSGFRNTDQYRGHFGVTPIFTEKDKCVFIDSVSSPLQINSVVNTNAGAAIGDKQIPLGDLGANGTSVLSSDRTIRFDAKDFGVLMCIYSVLPEATYDHFGVDMMNQKILRDDFFTPEFENIGLSPVDMNQFRVALNGSTTINGYAARYFEYKTGLDIQSAEFASQIKEGNVVRTYAGAFDGWSPARQITLGWSESGIISPRLFARDLYVSPMYYKDIFSRLPFSDADGDEWNTQVRETIGDSQYDSFIHQCYFDIKCVQPMSVLGMPSY